MTRLQSNHDKGLPKWWTDDLPVKGGYRSTWKEQLAFFNGGFVREALKHKGGIKKMPEQDSV